MREERLAAWPVLATLGLLVALNVPQLGSDPWPFRASSVKPHGLLGPLVRAAGRHWDLGTVRTPAILAGLLVALCAAVAFREPAWPRARLVALAAVVVAALLLPAVLLQVGLRQATERWLYTNDSTYQIELAGDLVLHGHDPYGHDYRGSRLERFYPAAGLERRRQVALHHFAYFPGTVLAAAAWRLLPSPLDDYRFLVLLATLGTFAAALLYPAPPPWRIAAGAVLAANPLAVRAVWFGTADAPSVLCLVLAFALLARSRVLAAAAVLAAAVLLKQFALVAIPFFAVMLLQLRVARPLLGRAAAVFAGIVVAGFLPFLIAGPRALWDDTVAYGAGTYRIIGYGLSALLLHAGIVHDRFSHYPFWLFVVVLWLPVTAWLLWIQLRARDLWTGVAAFAVSIFVLFFVSRVFQNSYLVWPLDAIVLAALLRSRAFDGRESVDPALTR